MLDHITLRVADLAAAASAFGSVLDELEIEQTTSTTSFSVWGNFALTQTDEEHPISRRVRIAFTAPTTAHVDGFAQAGLAAGFADDGADETRPDYVADYYAAFLKDPPATASELSITTAHDRRATSITSPSAYLMSRLRLRSTRQSAERPDSRSGARPSTTPPSLSVQTAATCS